MDHLISIMHWLGTKPLTVSLVAQLFVLALGIKSRDKEKLTQSVVLLIALTAVVVSIDLRPPSPVMLLPDLLGTVAAFLFLVPGLQALPKLFRSKSGGGESGS